LLEFITKLVLSTTAPTERTPCVPPGVLADKKMVDPAFTAVVNIVIVPAVIAAEVPIEAFAPVATNNLLIDPPRVMPALPALIVVPDVVVVEPKATVFAPAPVPKLTVVAAASALTLIAPVPEVTATGPFVEVAREIPTLPDLIEVAEVVLVDPRVTVLTPAPVARLTVVAVASVLTPTVPVPEFAVSAEFVDVSVRVPVPAVIATDVAPVAFPNVLTLAPVVAKVVAPEELKVVPAVSPVVVVKDPGAVIAEGKENVIRLDPGVPTAAIWLAVPKSEILPPPLGETAPPESAVNVVKVLGFVAIMFHVAEFATTELKIYEVLFAVSTHT